MHRTDDFARALLPDVSEPELPANEALAAALAAAANEPVGAEDAVRTALVASRPLVPLAHPTGAAEGAEPDVDFVAVEADGATQLVAFTDLGAFRRWGVTTEFAAVGGRDLAVVVLAKGLDGLWLNPAGPVSARLSAAELEPLLDGANGAS
jgi:hypothetical protein